jgi:hypothetical protein
LRCNAARAFASWVFSVIDHLKSSFSELWPEQGDIIGAAGANHQPILITALPTGV